MATRRSYAIVLQSLSPRHKRLSRQSRPGNIWSAVPTANPKWLTATANRLILAPDDDLYRLIWCALIGLFRSRAALEAEILVLRHQLNVLRRKSPKRLAF